MAKLLHKRQLIQTCTLSGRQWSNQASKCCSGWHLACLLPSQCKNKFCFSIFHKIHFVLIVLRQVLRGSFIGLWSPSVSLSFLEEEKRVKLKLCNADARQGDPISRTESCLKYFAQSLAQIVFNWLSFDLSFHKYQIRTIAAKTARVRFTY